MSPFDWRPEETDQPALTIDVMKERIKAGFDAAAAETPKGTVTFEYSPMKLAPKAVESLRLTDAEVDRIAEKVAERVFLALDRRDEARRLMAQFHVGDR